MVLLFLCSLGGALLAQQGGQDSDWKRNWAGSTISRALTPVGKTVLLEGFESTAVEAVGQAVSAADNYRFSSRAPQLRLVPDAKDGGGAGLIVSEGTDFGMFASSREGWKQLHFSVKRGALSGCTGIRFWMRATEAYEALTISITESGPAPAPGGAPRSHRAAMDVPGDGQWHEVVIPFVETSCAPLLPWMPRPSAGSPSPCPITAPAPCPSTSSKRSAPRPERFPSPFSIP
jgi:hypothetical protein